MMVFFSYWICLPQIHWDLELLTCFMELHFEKSCCRKLKSVQVVDTSRSVMAHSDAQEGKWRGSWRMEWVASTPHTTSEHGVSSITTADAHTWVAGSGLSWRPPADLNGLFRFAERRNLLSARVPSHFKISLLCQCQELGFFILWNTRAVHYSKMVPTYEWKYLHI